MQKMTRIKCYISRDRNDGTVNFTGTRPVESDGAYYRLHGRGWLTDMCSTQFKRAAGSLLGVRRGQVKRCVITIEVAE